MFFSDARQDEFVARLFNFKKNGTFVDIGSCSAVASNNTFFFESLDWNGLCVEYNSTFNDSYKARKCKYINADALKLDYLSIFKELNLPKNIDYLSLDIDQLSFEALNKMPHDHYRFNVITIEHDLYHLGSTYKDKQTELLLGRGYKLICNNVFVEQDGFGRNLPFEDWWVNPSLFSEELFNKIKSANEYPSNIIAKFQL